MGRQCRAVPHGSSCTLRRPFTASQHENRNTTEVESDSLAGGAAPCGGGSRVPSTFPLPQAVPQHEAGPRWQFATLGTPMTPSLPAARPGRGASEFLSLSLGTQNVGPLNDPAQGAYHELALQPIERPPGSEA